MPNLTNDLFETPQPKTPADWQQLDFLARQLFTPHAPIDEEQLFAGRFHLVEVLVDAVLQKGQHAILYGERGVGKTSLANMVHTQLFTNSQRHKITKRNCTREMGFKQIWTQLLDDMVVDDGVPLSQELGDAPGAYEVFRLVERYPLNTRPIFFIDEYDRVMDAETHFRMADTIKYMSDHAIDATIVIIGVADDVTELFGGHPSIQRNVRQIAMPVMSQNELHLIFDTRMRELGMSLDESVQDFIVRLSQGLPGYTHLLGQNAVRVAIERRSMHVGRDVMPTAMRRALETCDEKIRSLYADAVRSTKPNNQYREVLLACALARCTDRGFFSASSVKAPLSTIMKEERDIPTFNRHLKEFCQHERGPTLMRVGNPKSYEYKFTDALLRPFVIIKGLSDGLIQPEALTPS